MKKTFTHDYIKENKGCYDDFKIEKLLQTALKEITIENIVNSDIPLKDKFWFVCKKCELTREQLVELAIGCAEVVLPIYKTKYLNKESVRECIKATKLFITGHITIKQLLEKRIVVCASGADASDAAAYAAASAASAAYASDAAACASAYAAANAAASAAYAAAYASDAAAAYAAANAADYAVDASDAAAYAAANAVDADAKYTKQLFDFLLKFINKNI